MAHRIVPGVVKGFEAKVHEQGKVEASKADGMEGSSAFLLGAALGGVCPLGVEPMVHVLARLEHRDQLLGHRDHLSIARVSSVRAWRVLTPNTPKSRSSTRSPSASAS